jgi:hypothetical protein
MSQKRQNGRLVPAERTPVAFGPSANTALTAAILGVVDQQIRDQRPPETRRTFERLIARGYAPEDARRLIGNVVAQEIFAVMQQGEAYNELRFIAALQGLPDSAV